VCKKKGEKKGEKKKKKSLVENSKRLTNKKIGQLKNKILGNYCYFTIIEGSKLSQSFWTF
jgi:hypothetical protein